MRFTAMVFDLDGTLLNTLGDLAAAVNFSLEKRGYPARSLKEIQTFVGNGVKRLLERALPAGCAGDTETCLADFFAYYNAHLIDNTKPYPGIVEAIQVFHARGVRLAVLSNKYDAAAKHLVQHFFGNLFSCVLGERPNVPKKPDPSVVFEILKELEADPTDTAYIGDSGVDMQTACNAKLYPVGVSWGFCPCEALLKNGAACIIDAPSMLINL